MMKLRNKKTGEIIEYDEEVMYYRKLTSNGHEDWTPYHPEDWEDYKPAEPLIKDESDPERAEKIRKAVRAWAEANDYDTVLYDKNEDCIYSPYGSDNTDTSVSITFDLDGMFKELEHRRSYTIADLCGEEEE